MSVKWNKLLMHAIATQVNFKVFYAELKKLDTEATYCMFPLCHVQNCRERKEISHARD